MKHQDSASAPGSKPIPDEEGTEMDNKRSERAPDYELQTDPLPFAASRLGRWWLRATVRAIFSARFDENA
jgi:hypothetical protein